MPSSRVLDYNITTELREPATTEPRKPGTVSGLAGRNAGLAGHDVQVVKEAVVLEEFLLDGPHYHLAGHHGHPGAHRRLDPLLLPLGSDPDQVHAARRRQPAQHQNRRDD